MNITLFNIALSLSLALTATGCAADQATRIAAEGGNRQSASAPDNVDPELLRFGEAAMQGRVRSTVDAYSKIEATADFRYFMHPTMEKDAVMEFDVANLETITLSPRIGTLDDACSKDPAAGEVEITYALDTQAPVRLVVARDFDQLVPIALNGAERLTVVVNHGNGVTTCDWFGLGVVNVG